MRHLLPLQSAYNLLEQIRSDDPNLTILKLKGVITEDTEQSVEAVIEALATNTHIQVLYFQGYGMGMRARQLAMLCKVLEGEGCGVWAMNIGESPRVSDEAWWAFNDRLAYTKLGAMFAEPNHLPNGVKPKMIDNLRKNRIRDQLHNLQQHPENEYEVKHCDKMWWHPVNAGCNVEYFHCQKQFMLSSTKVGHVWEDFPEKEKTSKIRANWGKEKAGPSKKRPRPAKWTLPLQAVSTPIRTMPCELHASDGKEIIVDKEEEKKQLQTKFDIELCQVEISTPVKVPKKTKSGRSVKQGRSMSATGVSSVSTSDPRFAKYKKECRDFEKPHDRMSNAELLMEWHSLTEAAKEEYAEAP